MEIFSSSESPTRSKNAFVTKLPTRGPCALICHGDQIPGEKNSGQKSLLWLMVSAFSVHGLHLAVARAEAETSHGGVWSRKASGGQEAERREQPGGKGLQTTQCPRGQVSITCSLRIASTSFVHGFPIMPSNCINGLSH